MISSVAEMYEIHPQTLRLYEREGLLKPSRTEGNTRLYTDEDLERLEFILTLARDLGVNISGMAIILQMRERMEQMQTEMQEFMRNLQKEMLSRVGQPSCFPGSDCAHPAHPSGLAQPAGEEVTTRQKVYYSVIFPRNFVVRGPAKQRT